MIDLTLLKAVDEEIYEATKKELSRQRNNLELIASENIVSPAVMATAGTYLTNKYAEGYPDKRYYNGCEYVDVAEKLAIQRLKELFGCEHANVQAHCGSSANLAVYTAMLKPGDTIMGMSLADGGHLTHGAKVSLSGKLYNSVQYGVNAETGLIDYDEVEKMALECKPKMIVAGASAYPRDFDFPRFRAIADKVGAYLMVDIAHVAGLIAAGLHSSPIPYADFVTSTTHKTLRGPRGGIIMCKEQYAQLIDKAIFPSLQGGPLMHIIAAKAVAFKEALSPEFKLYQKKVKDNAKKLAETLMKRGIKLVSNGTDNHLMLVNLIGTGVTGKVLAENLDKANITVNKNAVPNDPEKPFVTSGIRIGTPSVTTRGMNENDMVEIGNIIADIVEQGEAAIQKSQQKVLNLCAKYPIYEGEIVI